jgi:hypothetical protein
MRYQGCGRMGPRWRARGRRSSSRPRPGTPTSRFRTRTPWGTPPGSARRCPPRRHGHEVRGRRAARGPGTAAPAAAGAEPRRPSEQLGRRRQRKLSCLASPYSQSLTVSQSSQPLSSVMSEAAFGSVRHIDTPWSLLIHLPVFPPPPHVTWSFLPQVGQARSRLGMESGG